MITNQKFEGVNSYATYQNAVNAVEKKLGKGWMADPQEQGDYRYIIQATEDGRFRPVFIGQNCLQAGTHFHFATTA